MRGSVSNMTEDSPDPKWEMASTQALLNELRVCQSKLRRQTAELERLGESVQRFQMLTDQIEDVLFIYQPSSSRVTASWFRTDSP